MKNKTISSDQQQLSAFPPVDDNDHQNSDVSSSEIDDSSIRINEETLKVFYCHQKDFHSTLIDGTLNDEGIGKCKMFNRIVTCPIIIQCNMNEADDCCEGNFEITCGWNKERWKCSICR